MKRLVALMLLVGAGALLVGCDKNPNYGWGPGPFHWAKPEAVKVPMGIPNVK